MPAIFVNTQVRTAGTTVVGRDGSLEGNKCFVCALVSAVQTVLGVTLDPTVIRSVLSHVAYGVMVDTNNVLHSWDLRALMVRVLAPLDVSLIVMNGRREKGHDDYWLCDGAMSIGSGRNQLYLMNTPDHFIEVLADQTVVEVAKFAIPNPVDREEMIRLLSAEGVLPVALLQSARDHVMLQRDIAMVDHLDAVARQIDADRRHAQELADEALARELANMP